MDRLGNMYVCLYVHTHTHTYTYSLTHTLTHTHTHTWHLIGEHGQVGEHVMFDLVVEPPVQEVIGPSLCPV
jgi:hypothetical protein